MQISLDDIERRRAHLWRMEPARRISSEAGALKLIEELGFIFLTHIGDEDLPSIHRAAGGDWGIWWDWKQTLPERKACYYAKVLRRHGTFISWKWFPAFYRAYADPRPYLRLYRDGLLDRDEKRILDLLAERGPMMTRDLRSEFAPRSKGNTRRVKSILVDLQARFLITAAGGETTGWSHHRWDLVERWAPARALAAAAELSREQACAAITKRFVEIMIATTPADICWVFGWERDEVSRLVERLIEEGKVQRALAPELETSAPLGLKTEVLVPKPFPRARGR